MRGLSGVPRVSSLARGDRTGMLVGQEGSSGPHAL